MNTGCGGVRDDRTCQIVLLIVLLGLVARLAFLGTRVSHFDEARVAWWGLEYLRTGEVQYRFIIHGTFLQHVHRTLFALFGPSDFVARFPVALIGGILPLVALWFRPHLEDFEVVALAFFLAFNPILLYYARFARSTVLVAAFCVVAFAAFVRWYDGLGHRHLYVGAGFLALGFATKENAVVYVLCWLGAGALLLDTALFRPRAHESGRALVAAYLDEWQEAYTSRPDELREKIREYGVHLVGAGVVFALVVLFFYAPRGGEAGLWSGNLGLTLERTTADLVRGFEYWFGHGGEATVGTYRDRLGLFLETTLVYAGPLFVLAVVGFVVERYGRANPRKLVLGTAYWGFASVVGYPLGADIWGTWIVVNALVPLAVPAAVGLGFVVNVGRDALTDGDHAGAAIAALLLLFVVGQIAIVGAFGVYLVPTSPDNDLAQFAQPQQELQTAIDETVAAAGTNPDGPDVLFYGGEDFVTMDETATRTPACIDWFHTLPWAWYLDANEVSVTCAQTPEQLPETLPPVVVAEAECTLDRTVDCRTAPDALEAYGDIDERVPESYERYGALHRTTGGSPFEGMVVYVDEER